MSSLFALRALLFGGELFLASSLIMALAWLGSAQKSASARHLTWLGAFGALLALPVLAGIVPSAIRIFLAAPAMPLTQTLPQTLNDAAMTALPAPAASGFSLDPSTIVLALGALWLLGVGAVALRLAIATVCLAALKRRSRLYALADDDLPKVAATHQECELRLSHSENGPLAWGVFRPVILLPKTSVFWPRERLHAVLLHELAHIRRRDSLAQALSLLVCALYWPNPLVWMGARRLRREAEIAADDAVIVSGFKPSSYAGELLELAAEFRARQPALSNIPLFMAAPSALEARIESVLAPTHLRSGVTSMDVLKIAGLGLLATTAIAFACPSLAQDAPPAPPASMTTPATPPAPPVTMTAPEAPDATPAPPAPPTEADAPTPPAPPTGAAPADDAHPAMTSIRIRMNGRDLDKLSARDLQRMHIEIAKAKREAHEAVLRARPEIARAMIQARVAMAQARASERASEHAVEAAQPQIDEAMEEVTKARPEVDKALAEAQPEIDAAMAKVQPEIDRALAQVRAELAKDHYDVRIEERVDAALKRAEVRIEADQARDHGRESRHEEQSTVTDAPEKN